MFANLFSFVLLRWVSFEKRLLPMLDVALRAELPGDKRMNMLSYSLFCIKDVMRRYRFITGNAHRRQR